MSPPKCVLVGNGLVTKEYVNNCLDACAILPVALLVVPVSKGTELFTMYGSDYSSREYKPWRDRKGHKKRVIDKAHYLVDTNSEQLKKFYL